MGQQQREAFAAAARRRRRRDWAMVLAMAVGCGVAMTVATIWALGGWA